MHTVKLRQVDGTIMFPVPDAMVNSLGLSPSSSVDVEISNGSLMVRPQARPRPRLADLIAKCDFNAPWTPEDEAWLNDSPVGHELI